MTIPAVSTVKYPLFKGGMVKGRNQNFEEMKKSEMDGKSKKWIVGSGQSNARVSPLDGEQDCILIPTQSNRENQFISFSTNFSFTKDREEEFIYSH